MPVFCFDIDRRPAATTWLYWGLLSSVLEGSWGREVGTQELKGATPLTNNNCAQQGLRNQPRGRSSDLIQGPRQESQIVR